MGFRSLKLAVVMMLAPASTAGICYDASLQTAKHLECELLAIVVGEVDATKLPICLS